MDTNNPSRADGGIAMVGFDGDDTLWRSQDFYDEAQATFERMLGQYIDLGDARVQERLYAVETYLRLLREFDLPPSRFAMIGNSLRSDIAPVLAIGGWGVHMPYHATWVHETEAEVASDAARLRTVSFPGELPGAIREIAATGG